MFGQNALSMPASSFAQEYGRLHSTSEPARPQPSGACQFLVVHPSAKSKICACQVYHHDRSAPGNLCDCSHPACYHIHSFGQKPAEGLQNIKVDLVEMVKRMEEIVTAERAARESDRAEFKRDIKALHEALVPFYRSEEELQRRLIQLEVRTTTTGYDQKRREDRMKAIGHVNDKHDEHDRNIAPISSSHHPHGLLNPAPSHSTDDVPGLTSSDERSSASSFSRHQTPSEVTHGVVEPDSPRSSGILNLTSQPRFSVPLATITTANSTMYVMPRKASHVQQEEPRSSGFLGVCMRDRNRLNSDTIRKRQLSISGSPTTSSSIATDLTEHALDDLHHIKSRRVDVNHAYAGSSTQSITSTMSTPTMSTSASVLSARSLPQPLPSPSIGGYVNADRIYQEGLVDHPPRQTSQKMFTGNSHEEVNGLPRPHQDVPMLALDVLANVSAASKGHYRIRS